MNGLFQFIANCLFSVIYFNPNNHRFRLVGKKHISTTITVNKLFPFSAAQPFQVARTKVSTCDDCHYLLCVAILSAPI